MIENMLSGDVGLVIKVLGKNWINFPYFPKSFVDNPIKIPVIIIKPRNVALAAHVQQIESEIFFLQPSHNVYM